MFLTHNIVVRSSGGPKTFDLPTADFGCHLAGVKRVYSAFCLFVKCSYVCTICLFAIVFCGLFCSANFVFNYYYFGLITIILLLLSMNSCTLYTSIYPRSFRCSPYVTPMHSTKMYLCSHAFSSNLIAYHNKGKK